jgi:hypothetical protein
LICVRRKGFLRGKRGAGRFERGNGRRKVGEL